MTKYRGLALYRACKIVMSVCKLAWNNAIKTKSPINLVTIQRYWQCDSKFMSQQYSALTIRVQQYWIHPVVNSPVWKHTSQISAHGFKASRSLITFSLTGSYSRHTSFSQSMHTSALFCTHISCSWSVFVGQCARQLLLIRVFVSQKIMFERIPMTLQHCSTFVPIFDHQFTLSSWKPA